jgi:hypothetical protein
MNNSSLSGYLLPGSPPVLQGTLTLSQFIQTVLVGVSGLSGEFVRPNWQPAPPKQPDLSVNWLAFGIESSTPAANSFVGIDPTGQTENVYSQRHETLEVQCSFYGPASYDLMTIVRDGFQVQQNLASLTAAKMGFTEIGPATHIPDLVNERWIDRWQASIFLQRMIQRTYPILTFLSVSGTIDAESPGGTEFRSNFSATVP